MNFESGGGGGGGGLTSESEWAGGGGGGGGGAPWALPQRNCCEFPIMFFCCINILIYNYYRYV